MTMAPAKPTTRAHAPVPVWARVARLVGWTLMVAGVVVGLFIFYLLFWTGRETDAIQTELLDQWVTDSQDWGLDDWEFDPSVGGFETLPLSEGVDQESLGVDPEPGSAYSLVWFERDGERIVNEEVLSIVQGVTLTDLQAGPGHYTGTENPGEPGNFAISGHRTTWSAPFYNLDRLQAGDEIHVVDLEGRHFIYDFQELRVVTPRDVWVLDDDPIAQGGDHWMTITTCHPRWSAAQRLIAFATLREVG